MYSCYADGEDLTSQVLMAKRQAVDVDVVHYSSRGGNHWKVTVKCSHGHENVFEGDD